MTFHNLARGIRRAKLRKKLLTDQSSDGRHEIGVGTPGVNVQTAASCVTRVDTQFLWLAEAQNVIENSLHTLFVELIVMAERDQVT